ncbi:MAG: DNA mismatch repair protein MutT [Candidatus Komeilibacteria bacterium CG_4_10_14_0_2_um_filter_37_10]|uniref:Oxidized purine nucleoside triphosphate hydrolase n=1 Tax=Candidatus Komeilibacteria bacterium CG_4_10_14_0_2_um_filter_37_10 TaxID=1974470 RepID=A0A2M7VDZ3_9BACT|nr:MAG: DNA mismatch repair protein MutT [Candidatus Komeilibacteria bacterium CG_4_10_14_0_2_um_filter_37_10]
MKILTLCFVIKNNQILLGMKKRGFGVGHWNGFGGKVEAGETIEQAAQRELKEEAGIRSVDLIKKGIIDFTFLEQSPNLQVHIFSCSEYQEEIRETEEMKPEWFELDKLPLAQMWEADRVWLPFLLANKKFQGSFLYDHASTANDPGIIIKQDIKEIFGIN